jgi:hypothetical protein
MKNFTPQRYFERESRWRLIHLLSPLHVAFYLLSSIPSILCAELCAEHIRRIKPPTGEICSTSVPTVEAWIGVIDQINPPWIIIEGERGERAIMPMSSSSVSVTEGQWVVVWVRAGRIEPVNPAFGQVILLFIEVQKERILQPL